MIDYRVSKDTIVNHKRILYHSTALVHGAQRPGIAFVVPRSPWNVVRTLRVRVATCQPPISCGRDQRGLWRPVATLRSTDRGNRYRSTDGASLPVGSVVMSTAAKTTSTERSRIWCQPVAFSGQRGLNGHDGVAEDGRIPSVQLLPPGTFPADARASFSKTSCFRSESARKRRFVGS